MRFHRTVIGGAEVSAGVRAILDREADALGISFYVDKHVDDEESVGFATDAPEVAEHAVKRLRDVAVANGVNIYVHKADYNDAPFENAIITGPSSKR